MPSTHWTSCGCCMPKLNCSLPARKRELFPQIQDSSLQSYTDRSRKASRTLDFMEQTYPQEQANQIGKLSTNYQTEPDALQTATKFHFEKKEATLPTAVVFSDALSVLQALQNPKNNEMNILVSSLTTLQWSTAAVHSSSCNFPGNKEADRLDKRWWEAVSRST